MHDNNSSTIGLQDFEKVDIRTGTVLTCVPFERARKPSWQLTIDFGPELGVKRSSAQITHHYSAEDLIGTQVLAVVNFPPRQIANFFSEVLVLGLTDQDGYIVLLQPRSTVDDGARVS